MDPIMNFLNVLLSYLLQFAILIVNFIVGSLELLLNFLRTIIGMSR